jgi:hypothetical protein
MAQRPAHLAPTPRQQHAVGLVLQAQCLQAFGGNHARLRRFGAPQRGELVCGRGEQGVDVVVGEKTLSRQVNPTRGYLSQVELPVTFGLGEHDQFDSVTVYWPDGAEQDLTTMK